MNEYLNPYTEDVTLSNVSIITANSTGSSISGVVAGGNESFYCNTMGCELRYSGHAPGAHVFAASGETEEAPVTGEESGEPADGESAAVDGEGPQIVESTGEELGENLIG